MPDKQNAVRAQFTLTDRGAAEDLHVGSQLSLSLDLPAEYAGAGIGAMSCRGHVVSVEQTDRPGKVFVVCEIDEMDCEPELWCALVENWPKKK
jgi:hypothetical protein